MIHYHGTPLTPESAAAQVFAGRHCMVSFANPEQIPLISEVCQSFTLDNGAFGAWRSGKPITDWAPFYRWVRDWIRHPGCDWFLIPDKIDGEEADNDWLVQEVPLTLKPYAVPVWHLHESINRLVTLATKWPRVAFGSSGKYAQIGTLAWEARMREAFDAICDAEGQPVTKLHGLRMLDPQVFQRFPFASCDSTNTDRNVGLDGKWGGPNAPAGKAARGIVLAGRIEAQQSAARWEPLAHQHEFALELLEVSRG